MVTDYIAYGRAAHGNFSTVVVTAAPIELTGRSNFRIALIISSPLTNPVFINNTNAVSATNGIKLSPGTAPIILKVADFGRLVIDPIFAVCPAGSENIGIFESMNEDCVDPSLSKAPPIASPLNVPYSSH